MATAAHHAMDRSTTQCADHTIPRCRLPWDGSASGLVKVPFTRGLYTRSPAAGGMPGTISGRPGRPAAIAVSAHRARHPDEPGQAASGRWHGDLHWPVRGSERPEPVVCGPMASGHGPIRLSMEDGSMHEDRETCVTQTGVPSISNRWQVPPPPCDRLQRPSHISGTGLPWTGPTIHRLGFRR